MDKNDRLVRYIIGTKTQSGLDDMLVINTDLARKIIVAFIRDVTSKAGVKKAVINLSGGIDSALAAFLTAEALGAENLLAVRLPYRTSSEGSLSDAQKVIDQLGLPSLTVPITPMVEPLFEQFPDMSGIRKGNIMARQRMIVAFDQSVAWGGLVVGTSNKTEALLGYTTLYGDSAAGFQPIEDMYKTQIRQLSAAMKIPQSILDKAPSADLWEGQTDEGELGFTYADVDKVLYLMVEGRYTVDEVAERGFDRKFAEKVWQRVRRMHFKRTMPNVAKLSRRSIGHDFLYLRDSTG